MEKILRKQATLIRARLSCTTRWPLAEEAIAAFAWTIRISVTGIEQRETFRTFGQSEVRLRTELRARWSYAVRCVDDCCERLIRTPDIIESIFDSAARAPLKLAQVIYFGILTISDGLNWLCVYNRYPVGLLREGWLPTQGIRYLQSRAFGQCARNPSSRNLAQ